jgi:hypothetical protein
METTPIRCSAFSTSFEICCVHSVVRVCGFEKYGIKIGASQKMIRLFHQDKIKTSLHNAPQFSIRRTCGAIGVLTAHFRLFSLRFATNSAPLAPHSHQNTLEKCIRLHRKSSWKFWD